jgi:hypothetical protein
MPINFGQTKSANSCINGYGPVAISTDFCLDHRGFFSAQERKMQLAPLTQSKTPQKNGLYDYPAQYEGNRQECKFVFNAPQDKVGQAG